MATSPLIVIQPYNPRWPKEFDDLKALLDDALGVVAARIDHIGSTSVPGLAAKDIIDIQISLDDLDDPRLEAAMDKLGATPTEITGDHRPPSNDSPEADWRKRYFRASPDWRATHLHVREVGRANQRYALLFRDYLRNSPQAAGAYEQIKIALARLHPDDVDAYYDVKDPACDLIMDAAERWATQTDWQSGTTCVTDFHSCRCPASTLGTT